MAETITYLNEEHDLVSPEDAFFVVQTETNDEGEVTYESWSVVEAVDGVLTEAGEITAILEEDSINFPDPNAPNGGNPPDKTSRLWLIILAIVVVGVILYLLFS